MTELGSVAIRLDANAEIGQGHLKRCVTLARQLKLDGFDVKLVRRRSLAGENETPAEGAITLWIGDSATVPSGELEDAEATVALIGTSPDRPSWVIVDSYELSAAWERVVRQAGHRIAAIDDFRNRCHFADVLISDTDAAFDPQLNGVHKARELKGLQFALLPPEFAVAEVSAERGKGKRRLLISYGGSDPTNETTKALLAVELLRDLSGTRELLGRTDVVVGPMNQRTEEIIRIADRIDDVRVHVAPPSLASLVSSTDVMLTAGGNTLVEALALRTPCAVTQTSDNQSIMLAQLERIGAIRLLGNYATVTSNDVTAIVREIVLDYERLWGALRERTICDYLGASRVSSNLRRLGGG